MPYRILLVQPEPETARAMLPALARAGYEAVPVRSASQARASLQAARPPELVVVDCRLPQREVLAFLGELRSRPTRIPAVVLSGEFSVIHFRAALAAGATLVMARPVDPEKLAGAVAWILSRKPFAALDPDFRWHQPPAA
jgi:DNA-binding NtrC family response regulator